MKKYLFLILLCICNGLFAHPPVKYDFLVARDGSGDFTTIQQAINAVPDYRKKRTVIFIKNGIYKEKLILPESKSLVSLIGESDTGTILTYDDYAGKKNSFGEEKGTSGSASFYVYGPDFHAENLTFENSSGPVGQAVAVLVKGERAVFMNCRFLGFQDTLYAYGNQNGISRQYYKNCYIEGTVDFIFGWATAWFENCTIFGKRGGFYTAASTPQSSKFGFVFNHCRLTGNAPKDSYYLGRPWRPYSSVTYLNCFLDEQVKPEGWDYWGKVENQKTVRYAEFASSGPGANNVARVSWARQLHDEEDQNFTLDHVLGGDDNWNPETGN